MSLLFLQPWVLFAQVQPYRKADPREASLKAQPASPPLRLGSRLSHTPANPNKLICNLTGKMMVARCLSLSTPPASLNSWLVSTTGIDRHQFHLHAPTRNHFIVNQSFWKHLTEGPGSANKPSIPAAYWQRPANKECNQHLFKNYLFRLFWAWEGGREAGMDWGFPMHAHAQGCGFVSLELGPRFAQALPLKKMGKSFKWTFHKRSSMDGHSTWNKKCSTSFFILEMWINASVRYLHHHPNE